MKNKNKFKLVSSFLLLITIFIGIPTNYFNNFSNSSNINGNNIQNSLLIAPIVINGNNELASHSNVIGNGTLNDPYIIKDFEFIGYNPDDGISITNTNKPLIIQNCTFNGCHIGIRLEDTSNVTIFNNTAINNDFAGIYLYFSTNNNVIDNTVLYNGQSGIQLYNSDNNILTENYAYDNDNAFGIFLSSSDDNTLIDNIVLNHTYGISLRNTDGNCLIDNTAINNTQGFEVSQTHNSIIENNTFIDNIECAIELSDADDITMYGNDMNLCGIILLGYLSQFLSIEIDDSNTVNGKPVYYFKNQKALGTSDYVNAGQIILVNCSDSIITDVNTSYGSLGISLYYSDNNALINNNASFNSNDGIFLSESSNNTLIENTLLNNMNGIHLDHSSENNTLVNNIGSNNLYNGFSIVYSNNNTLIGNTALANSHNGIILIMTEDNWLIHNTASLNKENGFSLYWYCLNNSLIENTALNNEENGISLMEYIANNTIRDNTINNNKDNGIYLYYSVFNNTISNNNASYNENNGILLDYDCFENDIISNNISNNENNGVYLYSSGNDNRIIGNIASDNKVYGIYLLFSDKSILLDNNMFSCGIGANGTIKQVLNYEIDESNKVNEKPVYYFKNQKDLGPSDYINAGQIFLVNCSNSIISDMTFSHCSLGISLLYSENNTIISNTVVKSFLGLSVCQSNDNNLMINNLNNNTCGISMCYAEENRIIDNKIIYNEISGINLLVLCDDNILRNNNISYNLNNGISISSDSDYNIIRNNTISKNKNIGIDIDDDSTRNNLYFNFFIKNIINAEDDGYLNKWDNDSIGNYWSNYYGVDLDNNGIGDTPYVVPGDRNNKDRYPIWDDGPTIIIFSPNNNDEFGYDAPSFNVFIKDPQLDTMWYSLNGGKIITFTSNQTFDQDEWDSLSVGIITITFYANDSNGNINSKNITVLKVLGPPIIIISPNNNDEFGSNAPSFIVYISDPQLDTMWYSLNGGKIITFTSNQTFDQDEWDSLLDGIITITFYANNTDGNINSKNVTIIKSVDPTIIIISPNNNDEFGSIAPSFIVYISDPQLDTIWYSLNGGPIIVFTLNQTFLQDAWNSLDDGIVTITFYANDTLGNTNSGIIYIVKNSNTNNGGEGTLPSYPFIFVISITTMSCIIISLAILLKKKVNLKTEYRV